MRSGLHEVLAKSNYIQEFLCKLLKDCDLNSSSRIVASLACLNVALDHHAGIVSLVERNNGTSAFTLARPMVEAYLKGRWLYCVADEAIAESFLRSGEIAKSLQALADEIQAKVDDPFDSILTDILEMYKKALHSYTHSGLLMLGRHISETSIQTGFNPDEMISVLELGNIFALLTACCCGEIFQDPSILENLEKECSNYSSYFSQNMKI